MKKIIMLLLASICVMSSIAQSFNDGNHQYNKIGGIWYLVDSSGAPVFEVDSSVITVKFNEVVTMQEKDSLYAITNVTVLYENTQGYVDLTIQNGDDVVQVLQEYISSGLCETTELNTAGKWFAIPNDPFFTNQWYLNQISAPSAWDIVTGDASVTVAIIDGDIRYTHEDIGFGSGTYENVWNNSNETPSNGTDDDGNGFTDDIVGWDFAGNDNNPGPPGQPSPPTIPAIFTDHGTRVAGIVAGKTDNSTGISGVAGGFNNPGVKLMILRVGDWSGPSSTSAVCQAINYAVDNGADIIQMSLGVPFTSCINSAIVSAENNGVYVVCASGNNGTTTVSYPASDPYVVAVGGTNQLDEKASCADYGPDLEIAAPAIDIFSSSMVLDANNDYVDVYSYPGTSPTCGTSFAAPQVSGLAALLLSVNPCLYISELRTIIQNTADKVGPYTYISGRCDELGYGRINAYQAVLAAQSYVAPSQTINTPTIFTSPTIAGDITIEPGGELIVLSTVNFGPNSKVIVKPGGRLIVDGGTLTSKCMWEGIEVWGDNTQSQLPLSSTPQGYVEFKSKALIENAREAVRLWKPGDFTSSGGILRATKTTFRNNWRSAEFINYQNFIPSGTFAGAPVNNASFFNECTFETTLPVLNNGLFPAAFVTNWACDGVDFRGCKFKNTTGQPVATKRGKGIISVDARYEVIPLCQVGIFPCPAPSSVPNTFSGLNWAIDASAGTPINTVTIEDNVFTDNVGSIILQGINYATVVNNSVEITNNSSSFVEFGVYLNACSDFKVEDNNVFATNPGALNFGMIYWNTGEAPNEMRNNEFDNLLVGTAAYDKNDGPLLFDGLQLLCSNYETGEYDIAVMSNDPVLGNSIGEIQGSCLSPVANQYTHNCAPANENDYFVDIASANSIFYSHYNDNGFNVPYCYDNGVVTLNPCSAPFTTTTCVPATGGCGGFIPCLRTLADGFQNQAENLKQQLDAGNTTGLLAKVNNTNIAATDLKIDLENGFPLSSEVLKALIKRPYATNENELEDQLDVLGDILADNKPLTDGVILTLLDRDYPNSKDAEEDFVDLLGDILDENFPLTSGELITYINKPNPQDGDNIEDYEDELGDMLEDHSPLQPNVLDAVINRAVALPEDDMGDILEKQNDAPFDADARGLSQGTETEIEIGYNLQQRKFAIDEIVRVYLNKDTLQLEKIKEILKEEDRLKAKCDLASVLIKQKEYTEAQQLVDSMRAIPGADLSGFCKLQDVIIQLEQTVEKCYVTKTDSVLKQQIEEIAIPKTSNQECKNAEALLELVFFTEFPLKFEYPTVSSLRTAHNEEIIEDEDIIKAVSKEERTFAVYPNPATSEMTIAFTLPNNTENGNVVIYDITGMVVMKIPVNNAQDIVTETVNNLVPGMYLVVLETDGLTVEKQKVIISR